MTIVFVLRFEAASPSSFLFLLLLFLFDHLAQFDLVPKRSGPPRRRCFGFTRRQRARIALQDDVRLRLRSVEDIDGGNTDDGAGMQHWQHS